MQVVHASTPEQLAACYPVVRELRPHLDLAAFQAAVERMTPQGYRLVCVLDPDARAVAGFRSMELLCTGPILYVDDLVTAAQHRSKGYGRHLLAWLHEEAKRRGCQHLELDSGLQRLNAHRFYEREGMGKTSFHFSKPALAKERWKPQL